ncbi:hypothetical protein [Parasitella parasitica]|uniref:RhoGAP-domain-containing protein n=1 Tax=Parasitella parasitica TaxID=35722 RepID=A0A0B7NM07_9FUNG|nr:hypothetical protein [Parasitella parasitica]
MYRLSSHYRRRVGDSIWRFNISFEMTTSFICAKCSDPVDCESNLLLLTNGRPVCESCSYCCNACKQVIRDEAIMTGDEAYHAECFRCVSCKRKIDDLVFTQTSKGIHCTPCHEKRRAEKQRRRAEREKKLQLKQQAKESPNIPSANTTITTTSPLAQPSSKKNLLTATTTITTNTNNTRPISRLLDTQLVAEYMQHSSKRGPPTPSRSRSNSVDNPPKMRLIGPTPSRSEVVSKSPSSPPLSIGDGKKPKLTTSSSLTDMPSLNLSFFDNDSTDLVNLTKKLGANISMDIYGSPQDKQNAVAVPVIVKTTENITRASQYLESSLMTDDYDFSRPPPATLAITAAAASLYTTDSIDGRSSLSISTASSTTTTDQLRTELDATQAKLVAMQTSYTKIKDASRKALEEFTRAKEEFAEEVSLRQQQEYTIVQLKHQLHIAYQAKQLSRPELASITKEEIERVAKIRVELDRTCNELKTYRNVLCKDIESLSKQAGLAAVQDALTCEIKSLCADRDQVRTDTKTLEAIRDDVLHEMVMLNTKNAELTEMNNDLSRRITEREREAAAVMAGTSFLYSPSPSLSSELSSPVLQQRKSSETNVQQQQQQQQPKVFKLKKKGNMFAKLSGKKDPAAQLYGHGNLTTSSTLSLSPSPEFPSNKKQSSESTHQHGSHTFLPTSFLRPVKCDACGEKMWGLSELRCQGCSYCTHARCLPHVPQLCYGSQTAISLESPSVAEDAVRLFGSDLGERSRYEDRAIPLIIEQCIQAVEKRGMDYEGIYRKSGGAAQMRLIHQSFDAGDPIDLEDDDSINDICAVTSVLKQYFRELPDPLLPFNLYPQFIDAVSNQEGQSKTDTFAELLAQLPKVNYDTLRLLIQHLFSVQKRHNENLMTTKNLAMVFGPTLLRDVEASRDLVDMSYKNAVVEFLITQAHDLLP